MRSSSHFLFCRLCGTRYRSDQVDKHERECQQYSKTRQDLNQTNESKGNVYLKEIPSSKSVEKDSNKKIYASNSKTENQTSTTRETEHYQPTVNKLSSIQSYQPDILGQEKEEMVRTPYPSLSKINMVHPINSSQIGLISSRQRPSQEFVKDDPKQAWNANASKKLSAKPEGPEPTKKYKHYPVSCEFCNKKFQPGLLQKHIQKEHPDAHFPPNLCSTDMNKIFSDDQKKIPKQTRKTRGPKFKVCYICGRQFGSKSLHIHEPQCLKKWRIQNEQLPKIKKMPEPVNPHAISDSDSKENLPGSEGYRDELPELNAENEAAYQSHLKNLVPCSFCGRKFNPDRVMVHENACIKKPKKRKYISLNKDKSK